jgi:hypothetical protein
MTADDIRPDEGPDREARCGAWGGCPLPRGHNRGRVDIPENHLPVPPAPAVPVTAPDETLRREGEDGPHG